MTIMHHSYSFILPQLGKKDVEVVRQTLRDYAIETPRLGEFKEKHVLGIGAAMQMCATMSILRMKEIWCR